MWKPNIQLNDTIFIKFKGFKAFDSFNEKNRAAFVLIFSLILSFVSFANAIIKLSFLKYQKK